MMSAIKSHDNAQADTAPSNCARLAKLFKTESPMSTHHPDSDQNQYLIKMSRLEKEFAEHRRQCAADKAATAARIHELELRVLELEGDFQALVSSEDERIDFLAAELNKHLDRQLAKVKGTVYGHMSERTKWLEGQLRRTDKPS